MRRLLFPRRPRCLLGEYLALRLTLPFLFQRMSMETLLGRLASSGGPRGAADAEGEARRVIERGERWAARLRFKNTCLYRALARFAALRRAGVSGVSFHLGLPKQGSGPGHAWVEVNGSPFMEFESLDFARTYTY